VTVAAAFKFADGRTPSAGDSVRLGVDEPESRLLGELRHMAAAEPAEEHHDACFRVCHGLRGHRDFSSLSELLKRKVHSWNRNSSRFMFIYKNVNMILFHHRTAP
jgi:hypothetical protein